MIERKGNIPFRPYGDISDLDSVEIVGRDPVGKTVTEAMAEAHPDWTDQQVAERINREYSSPVITVEEVARWRPEGPQ